MKNKKQKFINWDEYSIRTTAYYQKKGGVYSQLITVLMNMRTKIRLRPIHEILNKASFICDTYVNKLMTLSDAMEGYFKIEQFSALMLMIASEELEDYEEVKKEYELRASHSFQYPKHFKLLWEELLQKREAKEEEKELMNLVLHNAERIHIEKIKYLQEELSSRKEEDRLVYTAQIQDLQKENKDLKNTLQLLQESTRNSVDNLFTLDGILQYIRSRRNYAHSSQIIVMVKDLLRGCSQADVWNKVDALEQDMLNNDPQQAIVNYNNITGSNVLTGIANDPRFPIGVDMEQFIKDAVEAKLNAQNDEHGQG